MNNMKKATCIILAAILSLNGCEQRKENNSCVIDYEFKSNFLNCILIISQRQAGGIIPDGEIMKAYVSLEAITKRKSNVDDRGDTPYFYRGNQSDSLFFDDIKNWMHWYNINICNYQFQDVIQAFAKYSKDHEISLSFPNDYGVILTDSLGFRLK